MNAKWIIAKNALANLAKGGTAGVVALLLPAFLVRHMERLEYAVWVLVLQVAAYGGYLDFGLQTAIGRYVAFASEKRDAELRNGIFSTALIGLSLAGLICVVILLGVASTAFWIFPQIPQSFIPSMRGALLLIGCSIAVGLPASAWNGVFVGLQKNEIPAIITGATKILSAVIVVIVALRGHSIIWMATVVAMFNLASYLALYIIGTKYVPEIKFHAALVRWSNAKELGNYCYSLTIWTFAMMLVTGVDLLLVGRFQVLALTPYAVAASLVAFIAGAQNAIFSAIIPHAAVKQVRESPSNLGKMVVTSTQIGIILLVITAIPLLAYVDPILRLWVGQGYVREGHRFLAVLLIANVIRQMGAPYGAILIGTGQQRRVILGPLAEGLSNLFMSIVLGLRFGAIGVAYGTLIGAIVGMLAHIFYNIPHTSTAILLRKRDFVLSGIGAPALSAIPLLLASFSRWGGPGPAPIVFATAFGGSLLLAVFLFYRANPAFHKSEIQE